MALRPYVSPWMSDDLAMYREAVARFVDSEMVPQDAHDICPLV